MGNSSPSVHSRCRTHSHWCIPWPDDCKGEQKEGRERAATDGITSYSCRYTLQSMFFHLNPMNCHSKCATSVVYFQFNRSVVAFFSTLPLPSPITLKGSRFVSNSLIFSVATITLAIRSMRVCRGVSRGVSASPSMARLIYHHLRDCNVNRIARLALVKLDSPRTKFCSLCSVVLCLDFSRLMGIRIVLINKNKSMIEVAMNPGII